jgi:hypothetical protein
MLPGSRPSVGSGEKRSRCFGELSLTCRRLTSSLANFGVVRMDVEPVEGAIVPWESLDLLARVVMQL